MISLNMFGYYHLKITIRKLFEIFSLEYLFEDIKKICKQVLKRLFLMELSTYLIIIEISICLMHFIIQRAKEQLKLLKRSTKKFQNLMSTLKK